MATHRVDLRVEGDHLEYDFENLPPVVELGPEDTLVVSFDGVPEHYIPALSALGGGAPFGPFLTVQVEGNTLCCQGCSHTGSATFGAWPLLIGHLGHILEPSAPFEIRLIDGVVRHVRQIHLTVLSDDKVVVSPGETEQIFAESVIEWLFLFADPDHPPRVPVIVFEHYDGDGNAAPGGLGPFSALRINTGSSFEGVRFRIIGSGNNGVEGKYSYGIGVIQPAHSGQPGQGPLGVKRLTAVNRLGEVVDPAIDNTGSPP